MSDQGFSPSWHAAFKVLDIDTARTGTPGGDTGEWVEAAMRFAKKGFVLVFIKDTLEPNIALRVDVALPDPEHTHRFSRELAARLDIMGGHDARVVETGPPDVVRFKFAKDAEEDDVVVLLTLLLKVGDYVSALESDPSAPSPLERLDEPGADDAPSAPEPEGATVFESIGTGEPAPERTPEDDTEAPARSAPSGFEPIGHDAPAPEAPAGGDGEVVLVEFSIKDAQGALEVVVGTSRSLTRREQHTLSTGFRRAFRARLDVDVRDIDTGGVADFDVRTPPEATLVFELTPAGFDRSRETVRRLIEDTERYLERVVQFGGLGMSLFGTLDVSPPDGHASASEVGTRATRKDLPSLRAGSMRAPAPPPGEDTPIMASTAEVSRRPEPEDDAGGVVLGFSSAPSAPAPPAAPVTPGGDPLPPPQGDGLQPGNYSDPRLKRPDATTTLVDVVLRHPGYSDKRIAQVLSILLSVEYTDAKRTAEGAPCVIAWGIGRERAQTFKNVIEGAGGKALLVEPGTFGS